MGVAENICRACNKSFSTSGSRRRHEFDSHHFKVDKGRTVSPSLVGVRSQSTPAPMDIDEEFATPHTTTARVTRRSLFSSVSPNESTHVPVLSPSPCSTSVTATNTDIDMEAEPSEIVCSSCCHKFQNLINFQRHKPCKLQCVPNALGDKNPVVLRPPKNIHETMAILKQLSETDQIRLCQYQHWCVRDLYPITFPGTGAAGNELFHAYTANRHSSRLLKQFLKMEKMIKLPRFIIIEDTERGVSSFISESYLRPLSEFNVTVTNSDFVVTQNATSSSCGGDSGPGHVGGDDGGGDDSDPGDDWSDPGDDWSDNGDDDDSGDNEGSDNDSEDSGVISHRLQPAPTVPSAFAAIRHLLPSTFQPGVDGQG